MHSIKVLGSGCTSCVRTAALITELAEAAGADVEITKVTEMADIMGYGVMSTPGVVIDETVVHAGGVPNRKKVQGWIDGLS